MSWSLTFRKLPGPFRLLLLITFLAACDDSLAPDAGAGPEGDSILGFSPSSSQQAPFAHERPFFEISETIPEFAGFFIDSDGRVVANVTDLALGPAVAAAVAPVFAARGKVVNAADIRIREVQWPFSDLAQWRDVVVDEILATTPEVVSVDANERRNRVDIGVLPGYEGELLNVELEKYGVPPAAVEIHYTVPWTPDSHQLISDQDTIVAGVRMTYEPVPDSIYPCTLGPMVEMGHFSGEYGFLTNSHCTNDAFVVDSGYVWQNYPVSSDLIGQEIIDPIFFCSGDPCRNSDAAAFDFISTSREYGFAYIARPVEADPSNGSLLIDHDKPPLEIFGEISNPVQGDSVHKIGQTTGWTYGVVTNTCVTFARDFSDYSSSYGQVILSCQDLADYGRNSGDSGAPVFMFPEGETDYVEIVGMHNGVYSGKASFSAVANIEADFDYMDLRFGPTLH